MTNRLPAFLLPVTAVVVLFLPALLSPASVLWSADSDLAKQYLPSLDYMAAADVVPVRNPVPFSGTAALGNPNAPVAYPPASVYLLWPSAWWLTVVLVGHLVLLAGGMYRLARGIGLSPVAAAFAGTVVVLSGRAFGHVWAGHLWLICAWAWLPWALAFSRELPTRPGRIIPLALALGMSMATGALQVAYYTVVASAVTAAVATAWGGRPRALRTAIAPLAVLLAAGLGAAAAAATLWPGWLVARESARAVGLTPQFAGVFSLGVIDLPGLVLPLHLGHPAEGTYWAGLAFWERCLTPGAAVVVFGLVGLATPGDRRRWWLLAGAAVAIAFAMGDRTPVFPILFRALPGLDWFRVPGRAVLLALPCLALIAARGFDTALGMTGGDRLRLSRGVLPGMAGLLVVATVAWIVFREPIGRWGAGSGVENLARAGRAVSAVQRSLVFATALWVPLVLLIRVRESGTLARRGFAAAVFAVVLAEAWMTGGRFVATRSVAELRSATNVSRAVREAWPEGRILDRANALPPAVAQWQGIELIGGYDPLISSRYQALTDLLADLPAGNPETRIRAETRPLDEEWRWEIFDDLRGVGLLTRSVVTLPRFHTVAEIEDDAGKTVFLSAGGEAGSVVRRLVEWEVVPDRAAAARALRAGRGPVVEGGAGPPDTIAHGIVDVVLREPDLVIVETDGAVPATLMFSESWSGSWVARVDGRPVPVRPCNLALVGVAVPAGPHRVVLRADRSPLATGVLVSLVTASVLLMALFVVGRRSRKLAASRLSSDHS